MARFLMHQTWDKLLFLHWRVPASVLRPKIPARLAIDSFDGSAWITIAPFTMYDIRARRLPPIPFLSNCHELNVRTYVTLDGVPGVWFFSLDASNIFAVWGARRWYHLPYFRARMDLAESDGSIHFHSARTADGNGATTFRAQWSVGAPLPQSTPGTLAWFLTERYCLYSANGDQIFRGRIQHRPWPLHEAAVAELESTILETQGLPAVRGEPVVHALGEPLLVDIHALGAA